MLLILKQEKEYSQKMSDDQSLKTIPWLDKLLETDLRYLMHRFCFVGPKPVI